MRHLALLIGVASAFAPPHAVVGRRAAEVAPTKERRECAWLRVELGCTRCSCVWSETRSCGALKPSVNWDGLGHALTHLFRELDAQMANNTVRSLKHVIHEGWTRAAIHLRVPGLLPSNAT